MNTRIRKIAQDTDAWCDRYYFGDDLYDLEWEKKFAELIVQECAVLCRWEHEAHAMLEHFGVEL